MLNCPSDTLALFSIGDIRKQCNGKGARIGSVSSCTLALFSMRDIGKQGHFERDNGGGSVRQDTLALFRKAAGLGPTFN